MKLKSNITVLFFLCVLFYSCSRKNIYVADKKDSICYSAFFDKLKEEKETFVSIERLGGIFYFYLPCDSSYQKRVVFKENKITIDMGETESFIIKNTFQDKNITEYSLYNEYTGGKLIKKKIDNKYLFCLQINNSDFLFLTISSHNVKEYPLIIHHCKEKSREIEFDKLDLEEM